MEELDMKNIKISYFINILLITGLFYIIYLTLEMYKAEKQKNEELIVTIKNLRGNFETIMNKNNELIYRQEQQIMDLNSALKANLITNKELKDNNIKLLKEVIRLNFVIDTILKANYDKPPEVIEIDSSQYLKIPAGFSFKDPYIQIKGLIYPNSVDINKLQINDSLKIFVGTVKSGFLKPDKESIIINHSNPYIKETGMNNLIIKPKELPFYRKFLFGVLVGTAGTLLIFK